MDGQRRAVVARGKRGALKLLLLLPMLVVFAGCDLAITKSASPDPATVGEPLTYTLGVTNNPTDPPPPTEDQSAQEVTVTDNLPDSVELVSATPSQGVCTPPGADPSAPGNTVVCELGTLALNESATIDIVVTPTVAGQIENTATVQGACIVPVGPTDPGNCDPQGDNTATITTMVNEAAEPTPPDDQYGEEPAPPDDQYSEEPTPPGQTPPLPGDAVIDGDDGIDGVGDNIPAGNSCQNIASDIGVASSNNASQSAGNDTASQTASGDSNIQTISQDEAQAIAQKNDTTIGVVQQCAQGSVAVTGIGSDAADPDGDAAVGGAVVGGPGADTIGDVDANGDGVIDEAEARAILGENAPGAMAEADTDANGTVSVGEAEAYASQATEQSSASASGGESTSESTSPSSSMEESASTSTEGEAGMIEVLPDTGGAPLVVLAFTGLLLVASGLIVRRIVR